MADPNVRIVITATDRASGVLREVSGEMKGVELSGNTLQGSFTELSSILGIAQQGLQAVKEIYADTVGVAMVYAFQVDDVARATGMSAEESSR